MERVCCEKSWGNYSFLLGCGGLLIGYLETDDLTEARRRTKGLTVSERWKAEMASFFEPSVEKAEVSVSL